MKNVDRVVFSISLILLLCSPAISQQAAAPRPRATGTAPANAGQGEEPTPTPTPIPFEPAAAAIPQQVSELVRGVWKSVSTWKDPDLYVNGVNWGGGVYTSYANYQFGPIENGIIPVMETEGDYEIHIMFVPVAADRLVSEEGGKVVRFKPSDKHWKKLVDAQGWAECAKHPDAGECKNNRGGGRVEIRIIDKNRMEMTYEGGDPRVLTR